MNISLLIYKLSTIRDTHGEIDVECMGISNISVSCRYSDKEGKVMGGFVPYDPEKIQQDLQTTSEEKWN